MKDLCQKMEGKTNFSRHLNSLMAWLGATDLDPWFYDRSTPMWTGTHVI